jgi:hypothetical protein
VWRESDFGGRNGYHCWVTLSRGGLRVTEENSGAAEGYEQDDEVIDAHNLIDLVWVGELTGEL